MSNQPEANMLAPITGLDHVELLVPDLDRATGDYEVLLGRSSRWLGDKAVIELGNVAIVLRHGPALARLGLLCFEVDEPARMARRLKRLGLQAVENDRDGAVTSRVELDRAVSYSLPLGYSSERLRNRERSVGGAEILGLDHVVIASQHPDRAAALYGARLGLDMRFDSTRPDWGVRLMFFRCGDLVLEVVKRLHESAQMDDDRLHGLSWRTQDAERTQARLRQQGFDVSDVRPGRRPRTRVFTVHSRTAGIRTLFLESAQAASA